MSTPDDMGTEGGLGAQHGQPSEEELRAAYEAELARISSADMILQSAASLLNIGGLRLGLVPDSKVERDLEQVRDAIDGVRALLPILERHGQVGPHQLRPLREALSQLQMAYTRELQNETTSPGAAAAAEPAQGAEQPTGGQPPAGQPASGQPAKKPEEPAGGEGPGPAESSGRLWVPGR
jgi:hypothetical protein